MKFRKLKHTTWLAWFDCFYLSGQDYYNVNIRCLDGVLYATYEWEYDNGLYAETGNEPFVITWTALKQNMTYRNCNGKKEQQYIELYNGKCSKCGNSISKLEFYNGGASICSQCFNDWSME